MASSFSTASLARCSIAIISSASAPSISIVIFI